MNIHSLTTTASVRRTPPSMRTGNLRLPQATPALPPDRLESRPLDDFASFSRPKMPVATIPSPPTTPSDFDPEFDSQMRQFPIQDVFLSPDGSKAMICLESFGESPTGNSFDRPHLTHSRFFVDVQSGRAEQVAQSGVSGSSKDYEVRLRGDTKATVANGQMLLENEAGRETVLHALPPVEAAGMVNSVKFIPLPKVSEPVFMGKLADGNAFLVTAPKYRTRTSDPSEGYKAYIGSPGAMKEFEVSGIRRMRDGGTITMGIGGAPFCRPSPLKGGAATFGGQEVLLVSPRGDYAEDLIASLGVDLGKDHQLTF